MTDDAAGLHPNPNPIQFATWRGISLVPARPNGVQGKNENRQSALRFERAWRRWARRFAMTRTLTLLASFIFITAPVFSVACQADDDTDNKPDPVEPGDDNDHDNTAADDTADHDTVDAGGHAEDPNSADTGDTSADAEPSFYADVLPLLEQRCVGCHQEGGIAPFTLDSYEAAETYAASIARVTADRTMPPWSAASDGSCGTFRDSIALTDDEIATFGKWANQGMNVGEPREIALPDVPQLQNATTFSTPVFTPEAEGTHEAEHDEYRCFMLDAPSDTLKFATGYSVDPGTPEIVHHLVAFIVDPNGESDIDGKTNGELMAALDAESPDRDGWSCFGAAGDGVAVSGVPAVWAPGQGVVEFPAGSGTPIAPTDKVVVQMHYNLEDPRSHGKSDQTKVHFRLADSVERVGLFMVPDPFLGSYFDGEPATLEPGKTSVKYTWTQTLEEMDLAGFPDLQLAGIMPHMHELGHRYDMRVNNGESEQCGVAVDNWDFHWQRMYFYENAIPLPDGSTINVTCDYDTSSRTEEVFPGWGTQNEMCTAILYVTAPISAFGG